VVAVSIFYTIFGPKDPAVVQMQHAQQFQMQQSQQIQGQQPPPIPAAFLNPPEGYGTKFNPASGQYYFFKGG